MRSHYGTVQISLLLHTQEKVVTDRNGSLDSGNPTSDRKNFSLHADMSLKIVIKMLVEKCVIDRGLGRL